MSSGGDFVGVWASPSSEATTPAASTPAHSCPLLLYCVPDSVGYIRWIFVDLTKGRKSQATNMMIDELIQHLQVCNPTKIDDTSVWIDLSQGYRLIISRTDGGDLFPHPTHGNAWQYQVLVGEDETGWYPQNSGKEEYNSTIVSKVLSVVAGWKFMYEGEWPSWST